MRSADPFASRNVKPKLFPSHWRSGVHPQLVEDRYDWRGADIFITLHNFPLFPLIRIIRPKMTSWEWGQWKEGEVLRQPASSLFHPRRRGCHVWKFIADLATFGRIRNAIKHCFYVFRGSDKTTYK
ncbi:hypothetical protein AVEN_149109-1 [Araneus ventricosus]|uniref:Uncharacterized protein n=1 Tax=Araneus ventricosus TaxID=182803 RepID=A0A4Y2U6S5_ARAVE|nr:hypothetical protein AVEN_200970-1 [Araneus ventricosus]GBO16978.1 hypothetical protein AVEN_23738-1 [Araneus ventricosus]GBO16979.1 hypothetical protein AVEN_137626-1 [Araneus ventricosus]GBO17081.1 hypothetical protein AVEN_149109-1 [Araneus ventricosus]